MEEKEFSTGSLACVCVCFNREQSVVGNVADRARRLWRTTGSVNLSQRGLFSRGLPDGRRQQG